MQKHYELVCVVDARLTIEEIKKQIKAIESHLKTFQQDKDDMGLLPLAYSIKGQDQAYFVSYHISLDATAIIELKKELHLEKGLLKFHLFVMKGGEIFLKFADLKKTYLDTLPKEEENEEETKPVINETDF